MDASAPFQWLLCAPTLAQLMPLRGGGVHPIAYGTPAHSLRTLLEDLSTIVRETCRTPGPAERSGTFELTTAPTASQRRALELIEKIAA